MSIRETDPDFAVHQKSMVEVDDAFLDAVRASIDSFLFLAFPPSETMYPQQISICCLYYVIFGGIAVQGAEFDKVGSIADGLVDSWLNTSVSSRVALSLWVYVGPYPVSYSVPSSVPTRHIC